MHPMHKAITAPVRYLPEYLYEEPLRVLAGRALAPAAAGLRRTIKAFWRDLKRDFTANRMRRLGQAFAMARELPAEVRHLHVHYLHTPASVVRYAALLTGRTWTFSAHAKDIWTTPDWEKREKIADALWGVTCTAQRPRASRSRWRRRPSTCRSSITGSIFRRFPATARSRPARDGSHPPIPCASSPSGGPWPRRAWRPAAGARRPAARTCTGASPMWAAASCSTASRSRRQARHGRQGRCSSAPSRSPTIIALLREADLFVLPSKEATIRRSGRPAQRDHGSGEPGASPSSRRISPAFRNSSASGVEGELVPPGDWEALSNALNLLARDPDAARPSALPPMRACGSDFSMEGGIDGLEARFRALTDAPKREAGAGVTIARPVAFYAPLKSPNHPLPSGDRTMARLLMKALDRAGFAP